MISIHIDNEIADAPSGEMEKQLKLILKELTRPQLVYLLSELTLELSRRAGEVSVKLTPESE